MAGEDAVVRRPIDARTSLRHALSALVGFAAALAAVPWVLIAELDVPFGWLLESYGIVGFVTVAVGAWVWERRPANRTGLLLVVVGAFAIAASLGNTDNRFLVLVGGLCAEAGIAALAHLVLAFPSGRLRAPSDRIVVVLHYVVSIGWQVPMYVFQPTNPWYFSRLHIAGHEDWVKRANDVQGAMSGVLLIAAAGIVVQRWRAAPFRAQRRPLAAVYAYGIFVLVSFPLTARVLRPYLEWDVYTLFGLQLLVVLGVPFVYATALLSGGLARTVEIGELSSWLALPDERRPLLRDALARALGDPSIELLYRVEDTFVDENAAVRAVPAADHRGVCAVGDTGHPGALILYDTHLNEPGLVEAAASVAALAIERERLHAELVVSRDELLRSRLRLFEQSELERRQLAQNLHDAVQVRLVLAALHAGQLAASSGEGQAVQLRDEIDAAITELRQLVQGVLPALLLERGLFVAAEDLVDRMPIEGRLVAEPPVGEVPWQIESAAYFVLAEALTNVVKHSGAGLVEVSLFVRDDVLHLTVTDDGVGGATRSGTGMRGTSDRVAALGGRLHVFSEPGQGTRLVVELPCAS